MVKRCSCDFSAKREGGPLLAQLPAFVEGVMMLRDLSHSALVLFAVSLLFACSSDGGGSSGNGGSGGDGGSDPGVGGSTKGGSGGATTIGGTTAKGGNTSSTTGGSSGSTGVRKPLLDQPLQLAFDCSVSKPVVKTTTPQATLGTFGPIGSNGPTLALVSQDFMEEAARSRLDCTSAL
ncbi:MAG: hypothetical protein QM784_10890 [Polyangiaceae bacterium]